MTKEEFYSQIKKWEIAQRKYTYILIGCAVFTYFGIRLVNMYIPFATQTPIEAAIIIMLLSLPVCIVSFSPETLYKKYGLECGNCHMQFSKYQQLMHIGFTNKCPKCGSNIHAA